MPSDQLHDLTYAQLLSIAKEAKRRGVIRFPKPWVTKDEGFFVTSYQSNYPKPSLVRLLSRNASKLKELEAFKQLPSGPRGKKTLDRMREPPGDLEIALFPGVAGQAALKQQLIQRIYFPFTNPALARHYGVSLSPGLLLCGPPGNGKTYVTKAFCEACGFYMSVITGTSLMSKWYGETEQKIRAVFKVAQKNAPAVIFIDEVDAIVPDRDRGDATPATSAVNEFLTMLDGVRKRESVAVIGTTNRLEAIDPAVRRSGRLGDIVDVGNPEEAERTALLNVALETMPREDIDLRVVSVRMEGASRADVAKVVSDAGRAAFLRRIESGSDVGVTQRDLLYAIEQWERTRGQLGEPA